MKPAVILTNAHGVPYDRPRRADFASDLAFVEAFHEYKRRVTRDANESFDRAFVRAMRVAI